MCEYGHLERTDTVEQLKRCVQCALEGGIPDDFVMTPAIHTWGECNDQFGIGARKATEVYAGTWDRYLGLVKEVSEHGVTLGFFEKLLFGGNVAAREHSHHSLTQNHRKDPRAVG